MNSLCRIPLIALRPCPTHRCRPASAILCASISMACLVVLSAVAPVHANTVAWDDDATVGNGITDGSGIWDTTLLNWNSNGADAAWVNTNNDIAVFGNGGSGGTASATVALNAAITAGGLTFNTSSSVASYTIALSTLTLAGATPTITTNADATISSVIAGTAGLTKAGNGALTLSGTNTYTGGTTLNAGQLNLNNAAALGAATSAFVINGGTIDNTSGAAITLSARPQTWAASFTFNGTNALNLGTGAVTLAVSPTVTVNGSGATGLLTVGGVISGTGMSLTKAGTGTLTLSGSNTYTGGTVINGGKVIGAAGAAFNGGAAPSFGTGSITVNSGTTLTGSAFFAVGGGNTNSRTININGGLFDVSYAGAGGEYIGTLNLTGGTVATPSSSTAYFRATGGTGGLSINSLAASVSSLVSANFDLTQSSLTVNTAQGTVPNGPDLIISSKITQNTGAGSGAKSLTKSGAGSLELTGTSAYTGATNINAGTLELAGGASLASPSIVVASGAVFDVSGLTSGNFSLANGQTLTAGRASGSGNDVVGNISTGTGAVLNVAGTGTTGTLTINGGLTLAGGTVNLDLTAATTTGGGVNDLINVSSLNLSGSTSIAINTLNGPLASGTYTLIQCSGSISGSMSNLVATFNGSDPSTTRSSYVLGTTGGSNGALTLTVNALAASLVWAGDNSSNVWDFKNTANFSNGGSADVFYNNDNVAFNDSGSGTPAIAITGTLIPGSVTVNNSATAYTFGGTGAISGGGSLTKSGNGVLTITNANSYTGATTLNGGQLNLNNASAIGTGPLVIAGGTIDNTSGSAITLTTNNVQTWSGDFSYGGSNSLNLGTGAVTLTGNHVVTVNGTVATGTLTVGGIISGAYSLTMAGTGTLALTGNSTYSGGTVINGGTVIGGNSIVFTGGNAPAFGTGAITVNAGATLTGSATFSVGGGNANTRVININGGLFDVSYAGAGGEYIGTLNLTGGTVAASTAPTAYFRATGGAGGLSINSLAASASSVVSANFDLTQSSLTVNTAQGTVPNGQDLVISGKITENTGAGTGAKSLTKNGAGTLVLSGVNKYTGGTTIGGGTLVLSGSGTLGANTGGVTFSSAAILDLGGSTQTVGTVTLSSATGGATIQNGTLSAASFNAQSAGGTDTVNAVLQGTGALSKSGASTLVLTQANTYSGGTTVTGGTLVVSGSISGTTNVSGGTLSGGGLTGPVNVSTGGTLAPGPVGSTGNLFTQDLGFNGGTLAINLNTSNATSSQELANGNLTLGTGAVLALNDLGGNLTLTTGTVFNIVDYTGTWDGGVFQVGGTNIPEGGSFAFGANRFQVDYEASLGTISAVTLTVMVPEPGAVANLALGGLFLAGLGRLRRGNRCRAL